MSMLEPKPDPLACYECLLRYGGQGWCDVVVPDDVWRQISPTGDEGGILCFNCIARRLEEFDLRNVPVMITSGPFAPVHLSDEGMWSEVKRRGLVTEIGFVNPEIVVDKPAGQAYVFFERTWLNRHPVYGLRGGDTVRKLD